jgi:hypothetical protein
MRAVNVSEILGCNHFPSVENRLLIPASLTWSGMMSPPRERFLSFHSCNPCTAHQANNSLQCRRPTGIHRLARMRNPRWCVSASRCANLLERSKLAGERILTRSGDKGYRGIIQRFPLPSRARAAAERTGETQRLDSTCGAASDAPIAAPHGGLAMFAARRGLGDRDCATPDALGSRGRFARAVAGHQPVVHEVAFSQPCDPVA